MLFFHNTLKNPIISQFNFLWRHTLGLCCSYLGESHFNQPRSQDHEEDPGNLVNKKKKENQWHECFDVWWCFTYTISMNIIYNIVFIPFFMFTESFRVPHFYYGPDKNGFSLGSVIKNAEQVLGLNKWYWFLPVYTRWDFSVVYSNHL